ncbi:2074_t:CDS:2 [Cetraspora pellucida]|uniref:2074_t:CDS:1 n=1 Tax=Cetraspora pellucida TaxID=1433469 RepID=A0A9N9EWU7_9GLOM|nr:2074_t:CDS:2 [Cetraspora pellucida]
MNISSRNMKFNRKQHIRNVKKIQKNDEIFLTKLPDLKDQKYVDIFREKQEYATRVNINEIPPIELNLKNGIKESKIPIRNTEWESSALVITKKDGTKNIAINYRNINKYLEQYKELLPDSKQMLQTNNKSKAQIKLIEMLRCLKKAGLKIKLSKCKFLIQETIILNCKVSYGKIRKNVLKIKKIDKFTTSKNKTELQRFLGFMNYFRSFILDFAKVATLLYGLVETAEFNWTNDCQKAMKELKQ